MSLPLTGLAALLLLQLAARGQLGGTGAAPLSPLPVLANATGHGDVTQGALRVTRGDEVVECPLRHTDVKAEVSGFIGRVRVTQTFENPYDEAIEALYVFPLPHGAAVDDMTMVVGERRITGVIKKRREARAVYEQAIAQGQTAALLEQERPNIFTQSVGNIPAHQEVRVEITYVDVLPYEGGRYEFHFPMVVGPRYIGGLAPEVNPGASASGAHAPAGLRPRTPMPGPPTGRRGDGWAPDTTRVPDASRITPPVLKPGFRNGHDVTLTVNVDAGVPIRSVRVHNHEAPVQRGSRTQATVTLPPQDSIPNQDFVLSYFVAGDRPQTAVLSHAVPGDDGYFLLMVQPREMDEALRASPPRDVCFLIDVSGSMSGQPIAKVSQAMERFFQRMRPQDRLQVVTFAGATTRLFPSYVPATPGNVAQALALTRAMQGGGGTEMMQGIRAVLADPVDPERVRIVVMLTDGYIGNEDEIIGEVGRRAGDQLRFWTVGIGSSPNRHLLDGVARQGGGASTVLGLEDDPAPLVASAMERIQRAQLSRLQIDWGGLDVLDTYPARLGELWAGKPVFLLGRYRGDGEARLTLSGLAEGEPVSFEVPVALATASAAENANHAVLATAWARKKIEHLSDQMAVAGESEALVDEVTELALRYRIMSAYTSFVAVDESQPPLDGPTPPRRMVVPVPMPEGVSYEGVFGGGRDEMKEEYLGLAQMSSGAAVRAPEMRYPQPAPRMKGSRRVYAAQPPPTPAPVRMAGASQGVGVEGGVAGGVPGGIVGGFLGGAGDAATFDAPPAPPATMAPKRADKLMRGAREREAFRRPGEVDGRLEAHVHRAQAARLEAARAQKAGDLDAAQRALALAALLAQARQRVAMVDDGTLAGVLAELAALDAAREERAGRARPELGKPLDLVVRNADLVAALRDVARAAGVPLDVATGSLEDVAEAFGPRALRVAHADLRQATAARALTWLARPAGLTWSVRSGRVVVESARRAGGPWVYVVGTVTAGGAQPLPDVERTVRAAVKAADAAADVWLLTPDLLLVNGRAAAHARAAQALRAHPSAHDAKLRERRAARDVQRARQDVTAWTWPLLAAALEGRLDQAAASELLEATRVPGATEADAPTLRALWAVAVARRVSPADPALAPLWDALRGAGAWFAQSPPKGGAGLYALVLQSAAPGAVAPPQAGFASTKVHSALARMLAGAADAAAAETVMAAFGSPELQGDDALVLAALALHRGGGEAWPRFRERAAELSRLARASGAALQVANRVERLD
jgi:Ca-activated chloride channel family protein